MQIQPDDISENEKAVINEGTNKEITDENGLTPLHYAIKNNSDESVLRLIDKSTNLNAEDNEGYTPLFYTANKCSKLAISKLLEKGASPLHRSKKGETLLHIAAGNNACNITGSFINKGIDINAKNNDGLTALMVAVENRNTEAAKTLITAGADVTLTNEQNETAYDLSLYTGSETLQKLLLDGTYLEPGQSGDEAAKKYLIEGKKLYTSKNYREAADKLHLSLLFNDSNGETCYYLACALAQTRSDQVICHKKFSNTKPVILGYLEKAIKLTPELKNEILGNTGIFKEFHDTIRWQSLRYSTYIQEELIEILTRSRLVSNTRNTQGFLTQLSFQSDGTVILHRKDDPESVLMKGRYSYNDAGISVQLDNILFMPELDHRYQLVCGNLGTFTDESEYECD